MKVRLYAPARAIDFATDEPITDLQRLRTLDNVQYSDETFSDYISDGGEPELQSVPVTGGHMRFYFDHRSNQLCAETVYDSARILTRQEVGALIEYTRGQWSDGIGENFSQMYADEAGIFLEPAWDGPIEAEQLP